MFRGCAFSIIAVTYQCESRINVRFGGGIYIVKKFFFSDAHIYIERKRAQCAREGCESRDGDGFSKPRLCVSCAEWTHISRFDKTRYE